jgi:hypothetical protein
VDGVCISDLEGGGDINSMQILNPEGKSQVREHI